MIRFASGSGSEPSTSGRGRTRPLWKVLLDRMFGNRYDERQEVETMGNVVKLRPRPLLCDTDGCERRAEYEFDSGRGHEWLLCYSCTGEWSAMHPDLEPRFIWEQER